MNKVIPDNSKAVAPLISAELASTVSPRVTEWPEAGLSLKQPIYELTNYKDVPYSMITPEILQQKILKI